LPSPDSEYQTSQQTKNANHSSYLIRKKIIDAKIVERYESSGLGKRIQKQKRRATLTDFDRFKVATLKKKLGKAIRTHLNKNRKAILAKAK
jgi:hypothetical protein